MIDLGIVITILVLFIWFAYVAIRMMVREHNEEKPVFMRR